MKITVVFTKIASEVNNLEKNEIQIISVAQAIRKHFGRYRVYGMITSMSKIYNMISDVKFYCDKCQALREIPLEKPEFEISYKECKCEKCNQTAKNLNCQYVSVVNIELQDTDSFNDIERLSVLLFDKDTENVNVGERVIIEGEIFVLYPNGKTKGKLFSYFYANSIKYENRENIVLTPQDVEGIKKFRYKIGCSNIISELVKMFDPSIIGYEHVKEGLLLSAVNTGVNDYGIQNRTNKSIRKRRERINILLVGPPGLAKSQLLYSATRLVQNSRYESAENSSGKSLTAIVSKEDDVPVLRLGPIPQAKYAFCALNEIAKLLFEDQGHLLSILEEGKFSINKYGINATIKSPTTIIASANPISTEWKDDDKINNYEIPILGPLKDRFDLIFVFRKSRDKERIREYAAKKSELENRLVPNYLPFLIKYIDYAKQINPKFTDEATVMLNEYFTELSSKEFGSNRILDTLRRLAQARARLKLKETIDVEDAKETMQFYNIILEQYHHVIEITKNPKDMTYDYCISILKDLGIGITVEELFQKVCENNDNDQIRQYLLSSQCKSLKLKDNKKVRSVYELLINNPNIKIIQEKPIVLKWFSEITFNNETNYKKQENIEYTTENNNRTCDLYDLYDQGINNNKIKSINYDEDNNDSFSQNQYNINSGNHDVKNI